MTTTTSTESSARILKYGDARQLDNDSIYNFDDLRERCEKHVEAIREKTRQMILDAQAEAEQIKAKAIEDGHAEGVQRGMAEADEKIQKLAGEQAKTQTRIELTTITPTLSTAIAKLTEEREHCLNRWERDGVELASRMAKKIVEFTINERPQVIVERIRAVLQLVIGSSQTRIRVSPHDLTILQTTGVQDALIGNRKGITFEADNTLNPGDCHVASEHGEIDAGIETQLSRIVSELCERDDR